VWVLAIGDIHGCTTALDALLALVAPTPEDLIITLGDYVDRGPDSRGAIDRLLKLSKTHHLIALRGNHDIMMLDALRGEAPGAWWSVGGSQTLASYQGGSLADVPESHRAFLERTRDWYETQTHFFVHANVDPARPLGEQNDGLLFWEQLHDMPLPHMSGKIMICGHTSQKTGVPLNLGHAVCIDTWVYGKGWLTCLEVRTGKIWQANQRGETRTDWLDEPAQTD
jgi:serine/threonine protein phosphatase 1